MRRTTIATAALLVLGGIVLLDQSGMADAERRKPVVPESAAAVVRARKDSVPPEVAKLESYMTLASKGLDKRVLGVLEKLDGTPRRLLALKYYLARKTVRGSWAWTNKEMASYRRSLDFRLANVEVDKVISLFQKTYPGYQLRTYKLARSLEDQIGLWNKTPSVASAGKNLMTQAIKAMKTAAYPDTATKQSVSRFQTLLRNHNVRPVPTVAAPGLSHHGQLRAYDFIIWQGDKIVAGSDAASIRNQWLGGGWGSRLRQIVYAASSRFEGPLESPNEPWHFTYIR
jgi:hypothetical protein